MSKRVTCLNAVLFTGVVLCNPVFADVYVYPAKGQSTEKMEQDKYACYQWAKKNTGYDPTNPPRASTTTVSTEPYRAGRNVLGGAAKGAVVAGISGGDAGKGAAVGAIGGGVFGGIRHQRRASAQRQQAASQQSAELSAMRSEYDRAHAACLEGRGYTVK